MWISKLESYPSLLPTPPISTRARASLPSVYKHTEPIPSYMVPEPMNEYPLLPTGILLVKL